MDLEVSTGVVHSLIPYESHESVLLSVINNVILPEASLSFSKTSFPKTGRSSLIASTRS